MNRLVGMISDWDLYFEDGTKCTFNTLTSEEVCTTPCECEIKIEDAAIHNDFTKHLYTGNKVCKIIRHLHCVDFNGEKTIVDFEYINMEISCIEKSECQCLMSTKIIMKSK